MFIFRLLKMIVNGVFNLSLRGFLIAIISILAFMLMLGSDFAHTILYFLTYIMSVVSLVYVALLLFSFHNFRKRYTYFKLTHFFGEKNTIKYSLVIVIINIVFFNKLLMLINLTVLFLVVFFTFKK